jgi:hypothetical protein
MQVVTGKRTVQDLPQLAAQWHPVRNGELRPDQVSTTATANVWWTCPVGGPEHDYPAAPKNRSKPHKPSGCPYCAGQKVCWSNSLAALRPDVAARWHPSKNGDVLPSQVNPGSNRVCWWVCPVDPGHDYDQTVKFTARGVGCPYCRGFQVNETNSLATLAPDIAAQWHPERNGDLTPHQVTLRSNKKVWWRCSRGHEWQIGIDVRVHNGCPYCANKAVCADNCLATTHPEMAAQWDTERNGERTPRDVTAGSNTPVWWRCPIDQEHRWEKPPSFRTGPRSYGCPFCVPVQWSKTELRLAAELACFTDVRTDQRLQLGRRIVLPDILLPALRVAVEFDGSAWHATAADDIRDARKSAQLEQLGYRPIRLREEPLQVLRPLDVAVPADATPHQLAVATLTTLRNTFGVDLPRLEEYVEEGREWGQAAAEEAIASRLRAQGKEPPPPRARPVVRWEERRCAGCDETFLVQMQPCRAGRRFHSKACASRARRKSRTENCAICRTPFLWKPSRPRSTCGRACGYKFRRRLADNA